MAELEDPKLMQNLITLSSSLIQKVAESNDVNTGFQPRMISVFHGLKRPTISIQSYLHRIYKYANCSPSCFIVAYVYLDRFAHRQPSLPIDSFNVHRLLINTVMVSAKFMDDMYYNNAYYAKVGGISTTEMNLLEVDFLFGLGFHFSHLLLLPSKGDDDGVAASTDEPSVGSTTLKVHLCFNDEESVASHHKEQLAV